MTTQAVLTICSEPGCTIEVKSMGLCNIHYLVWYREQRSSLEQEVKRTKMQFGPLKNYICEGATDTEPECETTPTRWWVKDGDVDHALALCQTHTEEILAEYRKEIRRLELKV